MLVFLSTVQFWKLTTACGEFSLKARLATHKAPVRAYGVLAAPGATDWAPKLLALVLVYTEEEERESETDVCQ